jgi:uncharacterized membrane protein YtjA (UPF0391 family)
MLKWALLCFLAAIAAAFGQTLFPDSAAQGAAKVLCYASLAMFVVLVALGGGGHSHRT